MTNFNAQVGILLLDEKRQAHALEISHKFDIPVLRDPSPDIGKYIVFHQDYIGLRAVDAVSGSDLFVDFVGGKLGHRLRSGEGRGQTLAKAVGLKKAITPSVLDVTAGLGRDAFVLASLGCELTLIERSPWLALIVEDAMNRGRHTDEVSTIMQRMHLQNTDALSYLDTLIEKPFPDVIYMDPMYPGRNKSALVKKEMRIIRAFVGDDRDSDLLLEKAITRAQKRVVVKRPKGADTIGSRQPAFQLQSKNTRYDVYLPQTL